MLVLTYNFATAIKETTILNLYTLTTIFQLVSSFQNCELKQEPFTLSTELQQTHEFHGHGKTRTRTLTTELQQTHEFYGHGKNTYSATPEMWGRNCSEFVTSGRIFVLTLNRASALKVEDSEPNFLLPQNIVAITEESV